MAQMTLPTLEVQERSGSTLRMQTEASARRGRGPATGDLEVSTDQPFVATALVSKEVGRSDQPLEFFAGALVVGRVKEEDSRESGSQCPLDWPRSI
jgi:hypothetical protein